MNDSSLVLELIPSSLVDRNARPRLVNDAFPKGVRHRSAGVVPNFRGVRFQAALVRALLDELEASIPLSAIETAFDAARGQQLTDELAALVCRLRECAAAMTSPASARALDDAVPARSKRENPGLETMDNLKATTDWEIVVPEPS